MLLKSSKGRLLTFLNAKPVLQPYKNITNFLFRHTERTIDNSKAIINDLLESSITIVIIFIAQATENSDMAVNYSA